MNELGPKLCEANAKDLIELCKDEGFWLRASSKISILCQLPAMKETGQCVSTVNLMDGLRSKVRPLAFTSLKVLKTSLTFIRFEGELINKLQMDKCLEKLNKSTIKLNGFTERINVTAAIMKPGSVRSDWESFFRDNTEMNEMKPGLRPDTVHIEGLPIKWFGGEKPKPYLVLKVFETFGKLRRYHIPYLDELAFNEAKNNFENKNDTGIVNNGFKRFNFHETFDVYLMYHDYMGFVHAMEVLRGMKLVKRLEEINRYIEYDIKVDFDKTKHLSDKEIKRRQLIRKYGVKTIEEIKEIKEQAKKNRELYKQRLKSLKQKKLNARRVLFYLFEKINDEKEKEKQKEEKIKEKQFSISVNEQVTSTCERFNSSPLITSSLQKVNETSIAIDIDCASEQKEEEKDKQIEEEKQINETLISKEIELRERLLARKREQLQQKVKLNGGLRSVAKPVSVVNTISSKQQKINMKIAYKNHKRSCKHYRPKSIVILSMKQ